MRSWITSLPTRFSGSEAFQFVPCLQEHPQIEIAGDGLYCAFDFLHLFPGDSPADHGKGKEIGVVIPFESGNFSAGLKSASIRGKVTHVWAMRESTTPLRTMNENTKDFIIGALLIGIPIALAILVFFVG